MEKGNRENRKGRGVGEGMEKGKGDERLVSA